jgi:hypothetical protein
MRALRARRAAVTWLCVTLALVYSVTGAFAAHVDWLLPPPAFAGLAALVESRLPAAPTGPHFRSIALRSLDFSRSPPVR